MDSTPTQRVCSAPPRLQNGCRAVASEALKRATDAPDRQWLENLREQLAREPLFQAADEAFSRLREKGCETHIMLAYLNRIAAYKSGNLRARLYKDANPKKIGRKIRGIARQLRRAAKRIENLRSMWWGMYERVITAGCYHFPEELERMAQSLSRIYLKGYGEWNPQREGVLDLLDHVRSATGRFHYTEVSTLINARLTRQALERKQPLPDLKYDVDSLRMLIQRYKKECKAEDARLHAAHLALQSERTLTQVQ